MTGNITSSRNGRDSTGDECPNCGGVVVPGEEDDPLGPDEEYCVNCGKVFDGFGEGVLS